MVHMAWVSKTHKKIIYQLNSSNFPCKIFVMHKNTFKTSYSYNKKNSLADIVNSNSTNVKGSQPILNCMKQGQHSSALLYITWEHKQSRKISKTQMFCDSQIFMPFWGIHFMIIKNKSKS